MTDPNVPPWSPDYVPAEGSVDPALDLPWATESVPPVVVTSSTAIPAGLQPTGNWAEQLQQAAADAAQEALKKAAPAIQQQVSNYTQSYITGVLTGKPVAPIITGTTVTGHDLVIASARNRSWRTFLQGLGLDIIFALVALVGTLGNVDFFSTAGWTMLGILVVKTVIQTAVSYVARVKIAPPYEPT